MLNPKEFVVRAVREVQVNDVIGMAIATPRQSCVRF